MKLDPEKRPPRKKHPCPKCNRMLTQEGEMEFAGRIYPAFQCDECEMVADFMGERMELPLSFILNEKGEPIDPGSPDGKLRL